MKPKKIAKSLVCYILESQVKQLRSKYTFKIIAVCGSVGKTSTKLAVAKSLSTKSAVQYQDGNYNDRLTVPLVIFGHSSPILINIFGWIKIFFENYRIIKKGFKYELVVLELGADGPGQLKYFEYLKPDLVILSAIAPEHMLQFKSINEVAKEEIVPLSFSKKALINLDDTPQEYLPQIEFLSYGTSNICDYQITNLKQEELSDQLLKVDFPDHKQVDYMINLVGTQGAKAVVAAIATADILGWSKEDIAKAVSSIHSEPGRMQLLKGVNNSIIIDDTYNASPLAVKAALEVLYKASSKHKIAILGSMNELGLVSEAEHKSIGKYLNPKKIELVVTIGKEAKKFLAPAAKEVGCQVVSFLNPAEAGDFVKDHVLEDTIILVKGSQNGVFAEEAVKQLLVDPTESEKLVRQSKYWMKAKLKFMTSV